MILKYIKNKIRAVRNIYTQYGIVGTIRCTYCKLVKHDACAWIHRDQNSAIPTDFSFPVSGSLTSLCTAMQAKGAVIYGKEFINDGCKPLLLVSHECSLTGAPIALEEFAKVSKSSGWTPLVLSFKNGPLAAELYNNEIPVIVYTFDSHDDLRDIVLDKFLEIFSTVVVNTCTVPTCYVIDRLNGTKANVLWWIHESYLSYSEAVLQAMPDVLLDNIKPVCAGWYARNALLKSRPEYKAEILLYMIPENRAPIQRDILNVNLSIPDDDKINFGIVGAIEPRKGYTVLVKSIDLLPPEIRSRCRFIILGYQYHRDVFEEIQKRIDLYPDTIVYGGILDRQSMPSFYDALDCLICPSLDDPMPIVVTEAWQYKIPTICSENVGQVQFINQYKCGILYHGEDGRGLKDCIEKFVAGHYENKDMIAAARNVYDEYFSEDVFHKNVKKLLDDFEKKEPPVVPFVSVIIPVYNGGEYIKRLVKSLKDQVNISRLEIIVIDSGSTDGSVQYLKSEKIQVIEIAHEQFSHSYARNLGAEKATGEYLLFMTQDALPSSDDWVQNFSRYVRNGSAAAATCVSYPYANHDLFGKLELDIFNCFMQFGDGRDRISRQSGDTNSFQALRRAAQLSDVACCIRKEIFDKYKYRGRYGEDLDLGIRLIKDGEALAFMQTSPIYHSHLRDQSYIFKRTIVDTVFLNEISREHGFDLPVNYSFDRAISEIFTLYCVANILIDNLKNKLKTIYDPQSYIEAMNELCGQAFDIGKALDSEELCDLAQNEPSVFERSIEDVIKKLLREANYRFEFNEQSVERLRAELTEEISSYYHRNGLVFSSDIIAELKTFIPKKISQKFALIMAQHFISSKIQEDIIIQTVSEILNQSGV